MKDKKENYLKKITDSTEKFFLDILFKIGLKKLVKWYYSKQETMRYLIFGGISTMINILVFQILKKIGISSVVSNTVAWIMSVIFAYTTNKFCVFTSTENEDKIIKEISSFIICRIITLIIENIYIYIMVDILLFNAIFMKIISNVIVIILNYIFSKLIIFKSKKV